MILKLAKFFLIVIKNIFKDRFKHLIFFLVYLKLRILSIFIKKEKKQLNFTNPKIVIFYYIPREHSRYGKWDDGFTLAVELLQKKFHIELINIEDIDNLNKVASAFDIILIKASWGNKIEKLIRENLTDYKNKYIGFFISGSNPPLSLEQLYFYDILFYETDWYQKYISMHPMIHKAFGVKSKENITSNDDKTYDYIMYGEFKFYKNYHIICFKKGKRLVIGDYSSHEGKIIKEALNYFGVEVLSYMGFENISKYLKKSKTLLIPTYYYGGGERVLLETKYSTNIDIEYNLSNQKLEELDHSIEKLDYKYYSKQIENGLNHLLEDYK